MQFGKAVADHFLFVMSLYSSVFQDYIEGKSIIKIVKVEKSSWPVSVAQPRKLTRNWTVIGQRWTATCELLLVLFLIS